MSTDELKLQIFRQIDSLDANSLKEFYGMMLNYLNSKKESDAWLSLSENERKGLIEAIEEMNNSKGIAHNDVISQIRAQVNHA